MTSRLSHCLGCTKAHKPHHPSPVSSLVSIIIIIIIIITTKYITPAARANPPHSIGPVIANTTTPTQPLTSGAHAAQTAETDRSKTGDTHTPYGYRAPEAPGLGSVPTFVCNGYGAPEVPGLGSLPILLYSPSGVQLLLIVITTIGDITPGPPLAHSIQHIHDHFIIIMSSPYDTHAFFSATRRTHPTQVKKLWQD